MKRVLALLALMGCHSSPSLAYLEAPNFPPGLPFSPAVRVGDVIYVSGQIGNPPGNGTAVVDGGIEAETHQALHNIRGILEANGSSMDRVFKCTVMMLDMKEWPVMNAAYVTHFPNRKPVRSAFGATGLALGARVEIECAALAR